MYDEKNHSSLRFYKVMDMSGHPLFPTEFALHIFVELHCTISWVIMYEEFVDKICARYGMVAVYLCAV